MQEITNREELVYNVILDYLNQSRPFQMAKILPYINSRFSKASININNVGIKEILISLTKKKLLVEGSVLTKNELLRNQKRQRIYSIIKNRPGIIFNHIVEESKLSNYIVYWHLKILTRFDCVRKSTIGSHQIFFVSLIKLKDAEFSYFMSKAKSKQVIDYLRKNDIGVSKNQITTQLNMHHKTITKYLKKLEELNVIERKKISNKNLFFLKEEFF